MDAEKADGHSTATRPFLITFSGIDGGAKTTQIEHLSLRLQKQGLRVLRLSFWDHIAVWAKMRAGASRPRVGARPDKRRGGPSFVPQNSKHVRKWYLTAARSILYMLDVARLRRLLASPPIRNSDVVIFDRYVYDQIANLYSQSLAARIYGKILLRVTPAPDLAFLLDASPTAAFARKPEYPLEFMYRNRRNFLRLRELAPQLIIIPDARTEDVTSEIDVHIGRSRLVGSASAEEKTEVIVDNAVVPLRNSCTAQNDPTASI